MGRSPQREMGMAEVRCRVRTVAGHTAELWRKGEVECLLYACFFKGL